MQQLQKLYRHFLLHPTIGIDSRIISPGAIFFALKGESFNGNLFADEALMKGASLAVVDDDKIALTERHILVPDALQCLQALASMHRDRLKARFIAITGSNGKTTTKELIRKVLQTKFRTIATEGNLNNHIGVPLTLLSISHEMEFAIIEMGANHPGEIAGLCRLARPEFGLITNVGKAHLEGFGSLKGVIQAKTELYDHLRNYRGLVFVNRDNPLLFPLTQEMDKFSYGISDDADCTGKITNQNPLLVVEWNCKNVSGNAATNLYGGYNFENILAAISVGEYFNIPKQSIAMAISGYIPANNRSQVIRTARGNKVFLDAYNANPTSMESAIRTFHSLDESNKLLILGDMLELGKSSADEHQAILSFLKELDLENVILVGSEFSSLPSSSSWNRFMDVEELNEWLENQDIQSCAILLKGSRKIRLETILKHL